MNLTQLVQNLKTNPHISVIKDDDYLLGEVDETFFSQYPFLKKYKHEILCLNDNHVLWNYKDESGNEVPGGEFHLKLIYQLVNENLDIGYIEDPLPHLHVFEDHPNAGDGLMVGITVLENNHTEINLYDNGYAYRMSLDLAQYFEQLAFYRGIYNWQFLFVDDYLLEQHNGFMHGELHNIRNLHQKLFGG